MAWTNIPNANLAAGAPIRSVDLIALRDNIPAVANGDAGAPKVQNAAIASGIVNSLNGQTGAITNTTFGSIGSYTVACNSTGGMPNGNRLITQNNTYAGSVLLTASTFNVLPNGGTGSIATNSSSYFATPFSGTWRCMATVRTSDSCDTGFRQIPTIYVRIS